MKLLFFLLFTTLAGGLTSWATMKYAVFLLVRQHLKLVGAFVSELQSKDFLSEMAQGIELENDLNAQIDKKLDKLILNIKGKIPMAAMFLSEELETMLKTIAREEIIGFIPEMKELFVKKLQNSPNLHQKIEEVLRSFNWSSLIKIASQTVFPAVLVGCAIGLLSGVLFFYLF